MPSRPQPGGPTNSNDNRPDPRVGELLAQAGEELTRSPHRALELAQEAWNRMDADTAPQERLACRVSLGWSHYYLSLAADAAVHFRDALDGAIQAGLVSFEIQSRIGLGSVYRQLGRFDTALDHLTRAWHLAEATDDDLGEMKARIAIGEVNLALDHPEDALECFFKARALVQGSLQKAGLVDILLSLGQTFQTLHRNAEALEQLSRALVLSKEVGNCLGEARSLTLMGLLYRDSGEFEISEEYHLECLKICRRVDHPWGQLDAYFNLGDLYVLRGMKDLGLKHLEKSLSLAVTLDAKAHQVKTNLKMAELWERTGNLAFALDATRRALLLERSVKADEASRNVRVLLDQFQAEQARTQAELHRLRSEKLEAESRELKKALDSLRVISELGRRITSRLTVSGLFQTLYDSLSQIFSPPVFGLIIYNAKNGTMRYPFRIENGQRVSWAPGDPDRPTLAGWAMRHRGSLLIADLPVDIKDYYDGPEGDAIVAESRFRSAIYLPLFAGEDPIGVLLVQHPEPQAFDDVHLRFLETLSGYVVVALKNALSHRKVRRLNRQVLRLAQFDPLTGLANRRLLNDYLNRTIALSLRRHRRFAMFFLDLDGFKPVNDLWGHEAGDYVLSKVGKRLATALRDSDLIARVGGDEFVAVALEIEQRPSIEAIAQKLVAAITKPVTWNGNQLQLGVSIGIAVYPDTATDAETLITRADKAMYTIKRHGKNSWAFAEDLS